MFKWGSKFINLVSSFYSLFNMLELYIWLYICFKIVVGYLVGWLYVVLELVLEDFHRMLILQNIFFLYINYFVSYSFFVHLPCLCSAGFIWEVVSIFPLCYLRSSCDRLVLLQLFFCVRSFVAILNNNLVHGVHHPQSTKYYWWLAACSIIVGTVVVSFLKRYSLSQSKYS